MNQKIKILENISLKFERKPEIILEVGEIYKVDRNWSFHNIISVKGVKVDLDELNIKYKIL